MKMRFLPIICTSAFACAAYAQVSPDMPAPDKLTFPQKRGAVYDEIHGLQSLGRMIVTPGGDAMVYEWQRPYAWAPSNEDISATAARRKQTILFRVNTSTDRLTNSAKPTSELAFYPAAGATYYLGSLSPDSKHLSFYEIDRDDNAMRAAVVELNEDPSPKITWFSLPPDDARMDLPPVWTSNDEVVYAIKNGPTKLARAKVTTGQATPCTDCDPAMLKKKGTLTGAMTGGEKPIDRKRVPDNAKLIGQSNDGELSVFSIDTPEKLSLLLRKGDVVQTLFENDRTPRF